MSNTTTNVSAGKPKIGGAVYRAPLGTILPTAVDSDVPQAAVCCGYVSDAGVTNSSGLTSNVIKAWGGDVVLVTHEDRNDAFKLEFIEALNPEVLKIFHGDDAVSGSLSTGISVAASNGELGAHAYIIDLMLRDGAAARICIPNAVVSETGDVGYSDKDVIKYPVTLTATPDSTGKTHYEYIKRSST